jgi:hypothetical protein
MLQILPEGQAKQVKADVPLENRISLAEGGGMEKLQSKLPTPGCRQPAAKG